MRNLQRLANEKRFLCATILILLMVITTFTASKKSLALLQAGNGYELTWSTIGGGGQTSSGGNYVLGGTIGQVDAGILSGGNYVLTGGFWVGVDSPGSPIVWTESYLPILFNH